MPRVRVNSTKDSDQKPSRPALSVEAQENKMISLANDLAEKQLRDGTASSQVIAHFLKRGASDERIRKEILAEQKEMIKAKTEMLRAAKRMESLYADALEAFRSYKGEDVEEEEYDD